MSHLSRRFRIATPVHIAYTLRDVDGLTVTEVEHQGKHFHLRSEARGVCGKVFQAVGVALPPTVRRVDAGAGG